MKTSAKNGILMPMDEFTSFYNWSERTAVFFWKKKRMAGTHLADIAGDLLCMAAMATAMFQSF